MGSVGILIKDGLDRHVTNIIRKKGRLISCDLKFKGTNPTRIINIYVNCNDKEKKEREELLNDLQDLITEATRKNYFIIIMGDMNADPEKYDKKTTFALKGKYRIIQLLRNENFYDTQKITNTGPLKQT